MELRDKLKKLRQDKGMTQAQLAEALFVSRSTVAKWENGLGLPSQDSMEALEKLYGITQNQVATTEPETVIVEKNKKLHLFGQILSWTITLLLCVISAVLPFAIHNGTYGFTPEMAAGGLSDCPYIDTGDYRIYYGIFEGDWEDGRHWSDLSYFRVVKKHFWGCTVVDLDTISRIITKQNYIVGRVYSIKGNDRYYNIIVKSKIYHAEKPAGPMVWDIPEELVTAESITISGSNYTLEKGFLFTTAEPVKYFKIDEHWYDIE